MRAEIHTESSGFQRLAGEWNTLLKRSAFDTIFLTYQWQRAWWDVLGRDKELFLLAFRDDDGQLVGIAPLYREEAAEGKYVLRLIGGVELCDYLDIIVAKGEEREVYGAFLDVLADISWDTVEFHCVPESSPLRSLLEPVARRKGFSVAWEVEEVCPLIRLPSTWEEYLASLGRKERHEIKRKLRRIKGVEAQWYLVRDEELLDAEMEDFFRLHSLSSQGKEDFMSNPTVREFFRQVARITFKEGWLDLAFLVVDGEKAASVMGFDYNNQVFLYNSGYNPLRFGYLSVGIVLISYYIQEAIARGREVFDFMRGDEEYKYRFGARDTFIYKGVVMKVGKLISRQVDK